jgi:glyoxylase-like metal-dependent hydrolase (beta-lactamase superfamily II)
VRIGELEVDPILDGRLVSPWPPNYPQGPDVADHQYATEDGLAFYDLGGFLIRTGDRVVLVDAGGGPARTAAAMRAPDVDDALERLLRGRGLDGSVLAHALDAARVMAAHHGTMPLSLAAVGVEPVDVTDVVFTHLHFDHIGWASVDGVPFFPSATYRCARADIDYFFDPTAAADAYTELVFGALSAVDRLAPVLDRLEVWDGDEPIAPGVDVVLAPGHTPGSTLVMVTSRGERALLLGDIVHCPLELADEEFVLLGDVDQELADRTRERVRRELDGENVLAAAAHFPELQFGRLLAGAGGRTWSRAA